MEPDPEEVTGIGGIALPRVTGARHQASEAMLARQAQEEPEGTGDGE